MGERRTERGKWRLEGGKMVGRGKGESQNLEDFKESKIGGRGIPEEIYAIMHAPSFPFFRSPFFPTLCFSSPLSRKKEE